MTTTSQEDVAALLDDLRQMSKHSSNYEATLMQRAAKLIEEQNVRIELLNDDALATAGTYQAKVAPLLDKVFKSICRDHLPIYNHTDEKESLATMALEAIWPTLAENLRPVYRSALNDLLKHAEAVKASEWDTFQHARDEAYRSSQKGVFTAWDAWQVRATMAQGESASYRVAINKMNEREAFEAHFGDDGAGGWDFSRTENDAAYRQTQTECAYQGFRAGRAANKPMVPEGYQLMPTVLNSAMRAVYFEPFMTPDAMWKALLAATKESNNG